VKDARYNIPDSNAGMLLIMSSLNKDSIKIAGFELLIGAFMMKTIFCYVAPTAAVELHHCFGRKYCCHHQG
jgi:hypothetical protein